MGWESMVDFKILKLVVLGTFGNLMVLPEVFIVRILKTVQFTGISKKM